MQKRTASLSLGLKFVSLVVVVVSCTLAASAYVSFTINSEKHLHHFHQRTHLLIDIISSVAPEAIFSFDYFLLDEHIKKINEHDDVIAATIRDHEGRYITNHLDKSNKYIKKALKGNLELNIADVVSNIKESKNIFVVSHEIQHENEILGDIEIIMSMDSITEDHLAVLRAYILISFVTVFVMSFLIYYIFKKSALNRIDILRKFAENVGLGKFDEMIKVENNDELGRLSLEFNKMLSNLKTNIELKEIAIQEVGDLNKNLESKVQVRTRELNSKNHELSLQRLELEQHRDHLQDMIDEQTRNLIDAKNVAESSNIAKSEFLANMSHELRTPMHAILSFSRFGISKFKTSPPDKILNYFIKIEQSGSRLLNLLNDLLDLSKLESGKQDLSIKSHYLSRITKDVIGEFDIMLQEKGLSVRLSNHEGGSEVNCDADKIGQVVRNLISNSIKFSPKDGDINIRICDEGSQLRFEIEDQGIGIPECELEQVFDKFIQSSKTKTGAGGTGLGLPICREIIHMHNGEIAAEVGKSEGALFWFTLEKIGQDGMRYE